MQPTVNDLATATSTDMISIVNMVLGFIKTKAVHDEDGNTAALINRIERDLATLHPQYHNFDPAIYNTDKAGEPVSEQDPLFTAQSYEKTGAQDVNQVPYPDTDEDAGAPFVSKTDEPNVTTTKAKPRANI
jgi:hypothetical protein